MEGDNVGNGRACGILGCQSETKRESPNRWRIWMTGQLLRTFPWNKVHSGTLHKVMQDGNETEQRQMQHLDEQQFTSGKKETPAAEATMSVLSRC